MSIFRSVTAKFFVDLQQYYIGDLKKATKLDISSRLLQYDPDLDGVILSFSNVEPVSKNKNTAVCFCYADSPFVHIKMKATFVVFKPYKGCQLPATVTFVSSSAVSLTIFDYFQGFIDLAEHRENWTFRADKWTNETDSFTQNDVVVVEVTDVIPNNDGYSLNVRILRKSEIPPVEPIEPIEQAGEEYVQEEENYE
ncbi:hypothetical protein TRFO_08860 [Tritrichomonas foetus]|uniref:Uncharacterized protein n=1 Tax=Tritrichomonas foetus TaxID=1144522 RepID=A0A1J4JHE2_9EUKA|nr:hypothetical protein TRFO_08860 [Tritrichomonas foetus]|eukprot:OHS98568.1 hypothetical protein TRFO_08860 [Tritrichomonas foetus]